MTRATLILTGKAVRDKLALWAHRLPDGTRVDVKAPRRTLPQNDRFWAMLTEIAEQIVWHGQRLSADDWKLVFMNALDREMRIVPALDGKGFVNLGTRSSDLTKSEMSDLMELISAFAADRGVTLHDLPPSSPPKAATAVPDSPPTGTATYSERQRA